MSERYSRLFSLQENLYCQGSPVIIAAGALLKDNQTGKILAQVKFKNCSPKSIKALTLDISPADVGDVALDSVSHRYLDLSARRDDEFGQKIPIPLPDPGARSFTASVTEVFFTDSTRWVNAGGLWEPLPRPEHLSTGRDPQLVTQFKLEYGADCLYLPAAHKDLWICTCGAVNRLEKDTSCHSCHRKLDDLQNIDWDKLDVHKEARLAQEAAEAEQARADAEAKAKKTKKLAAILIPAAAVVIAAAVLISGAVQKKAAYNEAMALVGEEQFKKAIAVLEEAGYKDAQDLIYAPLYQEAESLLAADDFGSAAVIFEKLSGYSDSEEKASEARNGQRESLYRQAETLLDNQDFDGAIAIFESLGNFTDAPERLAEARYQKAEALYAQGEKYEAATLFYQIKDYKDAWDRSFAVWGELTTRKTLSAEMQTLGLKTDGTVVVAGENEYDLFKWRNLAAVSCSKDWYFIVGLKNNGRVITAGNSRNGRENVSDWEDIVAIAPGLFHTVGLKADGTVVAVGDNKTGQCEVSNWSDIVAIAAGTTHTMGLKTDGTVTMIGRNEDGYKKWNNIVSIDSGGNHYVGLKADGTVVADGLHGSGQCEVSEWTDIVAVSAGGMHTVGLRSDGTVVAVGSNTSGQCEVSEWTDIVAIAAGYSHTVGLKADGTVVATTIPAHQRYRGQCDVGDWTDIMLPRS